MMWCATKERTFKASKAAPTVGPTQARRGPNTSLAKAPAMMASLEKKPEKMGTPQMASQQTLNTQLVQGIFLPRPPMRVMSPEPASACMTEPAHRNRPALKKAWVNR